MDEKRPEATPSADFILRAGESDRSDPVIDLPANPNREAAPGKPGSGHQRLGDSAAGPPPDRSGTMAVIVIAAVILLGGGAVLWWWFSGRSRDPVEPVAPPAAVEEAAAPEPDQEADADSPDVPARETPATPALSESDSLVREVVGGLSRHAEWMAWLVPEELAMNFVRAVAAVAYDEPPQSSLEPLRPDEGYSVVRRRQRFYPAETSFRRHDLAVEVFDSIDVDGAARAYQRLEPLFEQAHDELGYPNEFGDTLELAVAKLLKTPVLEEPPELRLRVISFEYADPGLEELSPAQKLLLRLGPENGERVRTKVREIYGALH